MPLNDEEMAVVTLHPMLLGYLIGYLAKEKVALREDADTANIKLDYDAEMLNKIQAALIETSGYPWGAK